MHTDAQQCSPMKRIQVLVSEQEYTQIHTASGDVPMSRWVKKAALDRVGEWGNSGLPIYKSGATFTDEQLKKAEARHGEAVGNLRKAMDAEDQRIFSRPAHALGCTFGMCKPPKGKK